MANIVLNERYYEIIDSESPTTASFSDQKSSSVVTFVIKSDEILQFVQDVLGSAKLVNNSYISRVIPASSPLFAWQYASKIVSIKGYSPNGKDDTAVLKQNTTYKNIQTDAPPFVGDYKYYKITVQFESRNYNILTDDQTFALKQDKKYSLPRNGLNGTVTEEIFDYTDRAEYVRYVSCYMEPNFDNLTWGNGNFIVNTSANYAATWLSRPLPNAVSGINNTIIPKYNLNFNWYFVPFEFTVLNKRWTNAYNKINKGGFWGTGPGVVAVDIDWFPEGTLLFKKVSVKKYEPYYPFETINIGPNSSIFDYFTEYYKNQYCDISFECVYWDSSEKNKAAPGPGNFNPLTCKDSNSLFNRLQHPTTQQWYYVESNTDKTKGRPIFWSIPFETLWTYQQGE